VAHNPYFAGVRLNQATLDALPESGVDPRIVQERVELQDVAASAAASAAAHGTGLAALTRTLAEPGTEDSIQFVTGIQLAVPDPSAHYTTAAQAIAALATDARAASADNASNGIPAGSRSRIAATFASFFVVRASADTVRACVHCSVVFVPDVDSASSARAPPAVSAAQASVPLAVRAGASLQSAAAPVPSAAHGADGLERKGVWVVKPGAPVWDNANDWLERAFFSVFPFGCGGPSDPRRQVKVSRAECIARYLRTGLRAFAQADFALHNYDIRSRSDMVSSAFVRARCPAAAYAAPQPQAQVLPLAPRAVRACLRVQCVVYTCY
jgi:hypothetical protein